MLQNVKMDVMVYVGENISLCNCNGDERRVENRGPFKCYVMLFSWKLDPHPPPRNANNIEHYTFVTLFSRKSDTPTPPSALRNTWMAPKRFYLFASDVFNTVWCWMIIFTLFRLNCVLVFCISRFLLGAFWHLCPSLYPRYALQFIGFQNCCDGYKLNF